MKLTVIGGGGVRSMFLAKSLAQRAEALGLRQLVFMDNNAEKLRIYGKMAQHVGELLCPGLAFTLTTDIVEAVRDADYVITTIRVGGDALRAREEHIALELGILGQETTGAAGFSYAMRSIPVLAEYCALIRQYAKPEVKVFNFTNPAGVVSQALRDLGYDFTFGVCDAPSGMLLQFAKLYGSEGADASADVYGLNHHSWFRSIRLGGREVLPEIIANPRAYSETDLRFFDPELVAKIGEIPNEYLYYFYYREQAVKNILDAGETRGDAICEINRRMTEELSAMDVETDFPGCLAVFKKWYGMRENNYMAAESGVKRGTEWDFDIHARDEGGYAGVALRYIDIVRSGERGEMVLCVPNQGAIAGLLDSDVVEITCTIDQGKCTPKHFGEIPQLQAEMLRRMKLYERLAAEAINERSRSKAVDCLFVHPLVNSYSLARKLVGQYLELNEEYCNGWK